MESDTIIVKLEELGVDYLQGWGIGMPLELDEISEALASLET